MNESGNIDDGYLQNKQGRSVNYLMERNSLTQPVITTAAPHDKHDIFQSMAENKRSVVYRFPIQSNTHTPNSFPFSIAKSKKGTSFDIPLIEFDDLSHNRHEVDHFTQKIKDDCIQGNIERKNELDAFPLKNLTTKTKCYFPIKTRERRERRTPSLDPEIQISVKNESLHKTMSFPLIYIEDSSRFPCKESVIEVNIIKLFNIQAIFCFSRPSFSLLIPKLDIKKSSDNNDNFLQFPTTEMTLKRQRSKKKCSDELVFPIKTELFSNKYTTTIQFFNNSKENNISSSTMTQFQNLIDENICGEKLLVTNSKIQTNIKECEHEKLKQEQDHPTHSCLHNCKDDVLAIGKAKNIFDSGRPKNCDELQQTTEHIKNSRSASETRNSHKNMNDLQKQHRQQKGKEIQPTTITALANKMQRDDKIVDAASNANINRPTNLSEIYFENQLEPLSACFVYSEVRDLSSQEGLIVNDRFAYETSIARIRTELAHHPAEISSYVNELTFSTPTSTTRITTEAPHVQNECQCLVNKRCCSILNVDDFGVHNISTEIDGEGGEKRKAKTNVFARGPEIAMTLTKVGQQTANEEDNISVSSSLSGYLSGMKFKMNASKDVTDVPTRSVGSNIRVKSGTRQVMPVSGSNVLAAATDLSKLANFGKMRRESSQLSHSGSVASVDGNDSVLPTRTLLRRQRRLQSKGSEEKQEDPIERLNRLRARISGALTEVKGVLKHYSVDETSETNHPPALTNSVGAVDKSRTTEIQKITAAEPAIKDDGPVSFRFVKKVHRRSIFSEEDFQKIERDPKVETTEVIPTKKYTINNSSISTEGRDEVRGIEYPIPEAPAAKNIEQKIFESSTESSNPVDINNIGNSAVEGVRESKKDSNAKPIEIGCPIPEGPGSKNAEQKSFANLKENIKPVDQTNIGTATIILGTVNDNKSCNESDLETRLEDIENQTEAVKKELKRPIIKTKSSSRRASIALVEGSQIEPPVNTLIPLKIKTQRRPSDSEAIIKRKAKHTEADNNASIKKGRTVVKVKRPSVKNNADLITKNKIASNAYINQSNNNLKDAPMSALEVSNRITSVDAVTAKTAITATVPKTSEKLLTQLAITIAITDASSITSAEKLSDASTEVTQPLSRATNNFRPPTKLFDQNGAIVAALVSPLRTGESSSQTITAETLPLSVLVNNVKIEPSTKETEKDQCANEDESARHNQKQINESGEPSILQVRQKNQNDCVYHQNLESKPLETITNKNKDTAQSKTLPSVLDYNIIEAIKTDKDSGAIHTQHTSQEHPHKLSSNSTEVCQSNDKMPEQQAAPTPVKPVQVFAENDNGKTKFPTKKTIVKRIIRNNSVDKAIEKKKPNNNSSITTADKAEKHETLISDSPPVSDVVIEKSKSTEEECTVCDEVITPEESSLEIPVVSTKPNKPRKVKKKVIIKCQHRKLSVGETTFFRESDQSDAPPAATETLERAIAYVTDDEDETTERDVEPLKPIKSCIKQREFQIGDWVLYGERFRKTQVRWKKGQITERITSISYKINIDGKEISAHISYIKKYTNRKVNFGGKEYLEIDYEQIEEEERKARTYNIWNMV